MHRRGFLIGLATTTGLGATSGCLGAGGGGGDGSDGADTPTESAANTSSGTPTEPGTESPSETATGTPGATPGLSDQSFEQTGDCDAENAGTATISFGADAVTCTGCITGSNGCQQATLTSAEYDAGSDLLTVAVTTTAGGDTPEACTQQIVHRAYEATLTFEGGLPNEVSVVHESMGERNEAARATRE